MKPILYITYYWPPSGGAGVQRGLKFVKYLPAAGVKAVVLTVDPDQASYPSLDPSLLAEVPGDLRVIRTKSFEPLRLLASVAGRQAVPHAGFAGSDREGMVQRAMRWVRGNWMIPDARRGWVKHAVKAAAAIIEREGIDTVLISTPPHSSQLIGLELKKRFPHVRWIADLRDPWTDIYYVKKLMRGARAERRDAHWEARTLTEADAVVVTSPSTRDAFAARYGPGVGGKISVITNGYDATDVARTSPAVRADGAFRITYVGTMAGSYKPQVLFNAIAALRQHVTRPLRLHFVGTISDAVKHAARSAGIDDLCTWVPTVPHEVALREMAAADMLLLVIPEAEGAERIVPGKLFEYMAMERPILGIGPAKSDAAVILEECRAGRMFERNDATAVANWVADAVDGKHPPPDAQARSQYDRKRLAERLAGVITRPGR